MMTDSKYSHRLTPLRDDTSIHVDTGQVSVTSKPITLMAQALGSCVAVVIYDRDHRISGLAHIMLPGRSAVTEKLGRAKYAEDAIDALLKSAGKLGADGAKLEISLVGGANVLREGDIPDKVTRSVKEYLKKLNFDWHKEKIGGTERRSVSIDGATGTVLFSEGDGAEREL